MPVLETVRYRTKPGIAPERAVQAWQKSQSFAKAQPGFLSRKIAVTEDGEFLDLVEWQCMADAKAAAENFNPAKFPDLMELVDVLDESTMVMTHYDVQATT
ncbi:antibiotic biosynthesis monooxygenase [Cognatishimia sp.]|uniref:antibiotic biosynthesis monooxygenase family protein n=1 Tax=Cognatishimia sp. TaxID=2211648 RepID=UPI0035199A06